MSVRVCGLDPVYTPGLLILYVACVQQQQRWKEGGNADWMMTTKSSLHYYLHAQLWLSSSGRPPYWLLLLPHTTVVHTHIQ